MAIDHVSPPSFVGSVMGCRCPRCGLGGLFASWLDLRLLPKCGACGLDYGFANSDDGPTTLVVLAMGAPATAFGLWIEFAFDPPVWVHLVTTLPVVVVACVLPLYFVKSLLVANAYARR